MHAEGQGVVASPLELDELVDNFTLTAGDLQLLRNKTGPSQFAFGLLLKYLPWRGRFPRGRSDLPDNAVDHIARQIGIGPGEIGFYDWSGRQAKRHWGEVCQALGFRECSVGDADKLTAWLAQPPPRASPPTEPAREAQRSHGP